MRSISSLIKGSSFDTVVAGVRELVIEKTNDEGITIFETPSLALSIGIHLKKVAAVLTGEAIRQDDSEKLAGLYLRSS